jgi:hypothetical protein
MRTALIVAALTGILILAGVIAGMTRFFKGWDE